MSKLLYFLVIMNIILLFGIGIIGANFLIKEDNEDYYVQNPADIGNQETEKVEKLDIEYVKQKFMEIANEKRTSNGLDKLKEYEPLNQAAGYMSMKMKKKNFVSHTTPSGESVSDRMEMAGALGSESGCGSQTNPGESYQTSENILQTAYNEDVRSKYQEGTEKYTTNDEIARAMVKLFLSSESHRSTLLSDEFDLHGVGISSTQSGSVYLSHKFCEK